MQDSRQDLELQNTERSEITKICIDETETGEKDQEEEMIYTKDCTRNRAFILLDIHIKMCNQNNNRERDFQKQAYLIKDVQIGLFYTLSTENHLTRYVLLFIQNTN